jgi:hypothetical protein
MPGDDPTSWKRCFGTRPKPALESSVNYRFDLATAVGQSAVTATVELVLAILTGRRTWPGSASGPRWSMGQ